MDIFEQEDATPRDSPVPPEDEAAADDAANGAAEDDASGTETDLPDSPSTPNAVSAVDNVFDVEERTPRKKEKKKLVRSLWPLPTPVLRYAEACCAACVSR